MEPAATIRQLRFDVQTTSAELGRELPERFSRLFHGVLVAALTDELTRVASGPPLRLSELVLELPPIAAGRLEQDLPGHLRVALRRALAALGPGKETGTALTAADPLAGLRYFLLNGRLPWQLSSPAFAFDEAVGRALRQHPRALLALLREVGEQPWPRQRLARQLAPATIEDVIGLLAPADAPVVRAYLNDTLAAHRRWPLVPAPASALRQVLHELVLADLLSHWHTQFNRRAFVERQLRQLAAHYNLDLKAVLRQLVAALPLAGLSHPHVPTLPGIVHALHQQLNPDNGPAASTVPPGEPDANSALRYYLRHGSLPPTSSPQPTRAALAGEAARLVRQGRGALLVLAQVAGVQAAAIGLLGLLPPDQHPGLVRQLALGQARPVLALLEELNRPLGDRAQLWQQAVALLLASPADAVTPALRRWLPLQVPTLRAAASAGGAREQLFHYLLAGTIPVREGMPISPAQLRRELGRLLAQRDHSLTDFLHQHYASQSVLRRLAALAGFRLLTRLLPEPGRAGHRRTATQVALAALLGEVVPPTGGLLGGNRRQQMLREAYLAFCLGGQLGAVRTRAGAVHQLAHSYGLPARAMLRYLRRQLRQWPVLASSSFFRWLLGLAHSETGDAENPVAQQVGQPPGAVGHLKRVSAGEGRAILGEEAPVGESVTGPHAAGTNGLGQTGLDLNSPRVVWLDEAKPLLGSGVRQLSLGNLVPPLGPVVRPVSPFLLAAKSNGQRVAGKGVAALYLAWPATAAEGLAMLAAYRPVHAAAPGWPGPLLRWLAVRQPARVADWLLDNVIASNRWPGAAALLDFALVRQLLARARPAARQGLAVLEVVASRELGASPRLLVLLQIAVLLGYFRPATAGRALARLATAYGLPQRATATRLSQLAQRQPLLVVVPGWQWLISTLLGPATTRLSGNATSRSTKEPARQAGPGPKSSLRGARAPGQHQSEQPNEAAQAGHDLLFHYLLHGQAPWWHAGPLLPATLGQALRRAATPPQPLREFLRKHGHEAPVHRHLAALADFSLLHELLPPPGVGRGRRQLVRPALAALDQRLRRPAGASQERLRLFLQEAYLAYAGGAAADPLTAARQRAAASGLAWRTVLAWAATLLRQHPALAADPFFAALLQATLTRPGTARARLRAPEMAAASPGASKAVLSETAEAAWLLVEQYVQAGSAPAAAQATAVLAALLPTQAVEALARARPYLGSATARQRLAALLSPGIVERLLWRWWPGAYRPLAQVARGWLRLRTLGLVQAVEGPAGVWAAVLDVAVAGGSRPQQLAALLGALLRAENSRQTLAQTAQLIFQALVWRRVRVPGALAALLAARAGEAANKAGRRTSAAASAATSGTGSRVATAGPALPPGAGVSAGRPGSLQLRPAAGEAGPTDTAYITNAGLVLLWPFMAMLFDRLGYLEQRQFKSPELAERATHLLQFLVTGEEAFPEYVLGLNKLLCGVEPGRPLARALPLTAEERSTGEGLLGAVIARWEALGKTSVAGLRETFLDRAGKLEYHPERVALTVETKTFDILLDQRPWSISTIKLPWMGLPLYVTWR